MMRQSLQFPSAIALVELLDELLPEPLWKAGAQALNLLLLFLDHVSYDYIVTLLRGVGLATGQAAHGARPRESFVLVVAVKVLHFFSHFLLAVEKLCLFLDVLHDDQGRVLDERFHDVFLAVEEDAAQGWDVDVLERLHQVLHVVVVQILQQPVLLD